jgi:hypothetical protein
MQSSSFAVRRELAQQVRWDERLEKVQDPDFMIRLVRAGGRIGFIDEPQAVLYDDTSPDRISARNFESNMREWLARSEALLSPRARRGFALYALAHEVGKRSRLAALGLILANARTLPLRVSLKAAARLVVSPAMFKQAGQLVSAARGQRADPALLNYLADVEREASRLMLEAGRP